MPHLQIDYSGNLEGQVNMAAFCAALRAEAAGIEAFPLAGIRVRAQKVEHFALADGDPKHGFIDISVRLRAGREMAVKRAALDRLFEAARAFLEPVFDRRSLALSIEMREIDADLSRKHGSIRAHLSGAG